MKKLIALILASAVCLGAFAACGKSEEPAPADAPSAADQAAGQPADEQPAAGQPADEQPAAEQPADEQPAAEEPAEEPADTPSEEPVPEAPAEETPAASGFEGTEIPADGVIRTAAELGKVLTDGDAAGTYTVDAAELDMSGIRYGSLGREGAPFTGTFDFGGPGVEEVAKTAGEIEAALEAAGIDCIVDDREERPGVKFKDADLIGFPVRVVVGAKGLASGGVEVKRRDEDKSKTRVVPPGEALEAIRAALGE